jgi:hypothetical protein
MDYCIAFHYHGDAPTFEAGMAFADEAAAALVDVAEKWGCHLGGGLRVVPEPCTMCVKAEMWPDSYPGKAR